MVEPLTDEPGTEPATGEPRDPAAGERGRRLKRIVIGVAGLNLAYFWIEIAVALAIGSVSLVADSVDFLEDTAVNLLIFLALGLPLVKRASAGRVMAVIICVPAAAALVQAVDKFDEPTPPDVLSLVVTAGGAIVVNAICAYLLARVRDQAGSMSKAAYLAARNDVYANAAIIAMGVVTHLWRSGWPDIVLGMSIAALNLTAAKEVWQAATEERLAARALAGTFEDA